MPAAPPNNRQLNACKAVMSAWSIFIKAQRAAVDDGVVAKLRAGPNGQDYYLDVMTMPYHFSEHDLED